MIVDLEQFPATEISGFDVCIIGAGAAGITLAVELLRHGKRVVIVEGGGNNLERKSQSLYDLDIVGAPYTGHQLGRYRVLGGSTTAWAGQILELDDHDFTPRPWVPGSGWPIAKSELTEAYARALELEGLKDTFSEAVDVWRAGDISPPDFGKALEFEFSRWCPEPNFVRLHRQTIRTHANLSLFIHANACEFIVRENGETIRSVRCKTLAGKKMTVTADRFILCVGGIECSRFLLQPHANGTAPWNRHGMVGRHYTDHIEYRSANIRNPDLQRLHRFFGDHFSRNYRYHPKIKLALDEQRHHATLNVGGTVEFFQRDDMALHRARQVAALLKRGRWYELTCSDVAEFFRKAPVIVLNKLLRAAASKDPAQSITGARLVVLCEQLPLSESRITLSDEKDALGLFRARLDWRISVEETKTVRSFVKLMQEAFSRHKLGIIDSDLALLSDDQAAGKFNDYYHHMGGTRMARSATEGVVDSDLKIFGTRNAYVCSSSVFPSSGFSNPTHTLLALAVRLAGHLQNFAEDPDRIKSL